MVSWVLLLFSLFDSFLTCDKVSFNVVWFVRGDAFPFIVLRSHSLWCVPSIFPVGRGVLSSICV